MKAAILSAGLNRRLAIIKKPKGLIEIEGHTLLQRTIAALDRFGFEEVFVVVRHDAVLLQQYLTSLKPSCKLTIIKRNSRNPFYSQMALAPYVKRGGVLVFNVDAYYHMKDLEAFSKKMKDQDYLMGKEMIMWGMKYKSAYDDPAFIKLSDDGTVLDYGKDISRCDYVFGQVRYCSSNMFRLMRRSGLGHINRMKKLIKYLIEQSSTVSMYPVKYPVYDIDTPEDLQRIQRMQRSV